VLREWSGLSIFEAFKVGSFPTAKNDGLCIEIWGTMHLKIVHVVIIIFSMAKTTSRLATHILHTL
jgi:hypothetical protein